MSGCCPDWESGSQRLSNCGILNHTLLPNQRIMTREVIQTNQAPAPVGPYNQAIRANGPLIFVAGQIPLDPFSGAIVGADDVGKQTQQAIVNLAAILQAAGATLQDVVKTTVFLIDINDFGAMNAVYAQYFAEASAPARACVEVSRLPKDVRVEIDCIAVAAPSFTPVQQSVV